MTESLDHRIVHENEWIESRKALLKKEKEFTILRDQLSQQRRDLPWEAVNKEYVFEGPNGKQTLSELFEGRSQLIVYHFMFDQAGRQHVCIAPFGLTISMELLCT
jgi:predicted dithiol-disulfide oxidoreductase (DUF899 family)